MQGVCRPLHAQNILIFCPAWTSIVIHKVRSHVTMKKMYVSLQNLNTILVAYN